jgi:predicted phosphate transport protein (TIGR00153 family)
MAISNILGFLIPKEKKFFPLFEQSTVYMHEAAVKLNQLVHEPDAVKRSELVREIREIENAADTVTHNLLLELGKTFITPFDREDIQTLTTALDDVIDHIQAAAKRIEIYKMQTFTPPIIKLTEVIVECSLVLKTAMPELRNLKNRKKLQEACIRLNDLENVADDVFEAALGELFEEGEYKPKEILKLKEVLAVLEEATDRAEHASYVIEAILIKTA